MSHPAYSLRIQRKNGKRSLRSASNHNLREVQVARADPALISNNRTLFGPDTAAGVVALQKQKLLAAADAVDPTREKRMLRYHRKVSGCGPSSAKTWLSQVKKDGLFDKKFQAMPERDRLGEHMSATSATEMLLTASPDYFRSWPGGRDEAGKHSPERLEKWVKASMAFLTEQYGPQLLQAELHLDEKTPHIHVLLVPLVDNKLSHSKLFGSESSDMSLLQDKFEPYCKRFGLELERGERGTGGFHRTTKEFEKEHNAPVEVELPDTQEPFKVKDSKGVVVEVMRMKDIEALFDTLADITNKVKGRKSAEAQVKTLKKQLARATQKADQFADVRAIPPRDVLRKFYGVNGAEDTLVVNGKTVELKGDQHRVGGAGHRFNRSAMDLVADLEGFSGQDKLTRAALMLRNEGFGERDVAADIAQRGVDAGRRQAEEFTRNYQVAAQRADAKEKAHHQTQKLTTFRGGRSHNEKSVGGN
jgi:hypothetical protein